MKRSILLLVFALISAYATSLAGQELNFDCTVKVPGLKGSYKGECAKGLAHGEGEAHGTDTYTGGFRKGLPHGRGTYIWANGDKYAGAWKNGKRHGKGIFIGMIAGRDSTMSGSWKKGKYVVPKAKRVTTHQITFRRNVMRSSFQKLEGRSQIVITLSTRGGSLLAAITSFEYTEGTFPEIDEQRIYIDDPLFPFSGRLKYSYMSATATAPTEVEIHFTLLVPGNWRIVMGQ